jgi:hypothetical protein
MVVCEDGEYDSTSDFDDDILVLIDARDGANSGSDNEIDMGTMEEVKPNFRTPPRCGRLVEDWHAKTTYDT